MGFIPSYIFSVILIVWFSYEIVNDILVLKRGYGIFSPRGKVTSIMLYNLGNTGTFFLRMHTFLSTLDTFSTRSEWGI